MSRGTTVPLSPTQNTFPQWLWTSSANNFLLKSQTRKYQPAHSLSIYGSPLLYPPNRKCTFFAPFFLGHPPLLEPSPRKTPGPKLCRPDLGCILVEGLEGCKEADFRVKETVCRPVSVLTLSGQRIWAFPNYKIAPVERGRAWTSGKGGGSGKWASEDGRWLEIGPQSGARQNFKETVRFDSQAGPIKGKALDIGSTMQHPSSFWGAPAAPLP